MSTASERYPNLLSPISVGPMRLRHRAMMSGHGMHLGDGTGRVSDALRAYLVERALGGAALIGTESAPVHATSRNDFLSINLFDASVVNSLRRLADDVHEAGAKLSIILWHGGHNVSFVNGSHALAASPIPNLSREVPREISKKEILEIVKAYGQAAARCKEAGFDAVEVQTATSYLLGSFLSPAMNHRTDEYGGSFENRLRIVRQILQEIRSSAGGEMAVGVRTSTSHHIPNAPVDFFIEDSIAANAGPIRRRARRLDQHLVRVSLGSARNCPTDAHSAKPLVRGGKALPTSGLGARGHRRPHPDGGRCRENYRGRIRGHRGDGKDVDRRTGMGTES